MEIDCPAHAVALWLEGDHYVVRFPDQQLIKISISDQEEFDGCRRLVSVLRHREAAIKNGRKPSIGTLAAPIQYDIDLIAEHITRERFDEQIGSYREKVKAAKEGRAERDKRARLKRSAKRDKLKEADELLTLVGLS